MNAGALPYRDGWGSAYCDASYWLHQHTKRRGNSRNWSDRRQFETVRTQLHRKVLHQFRLYINDKNMLEANALPDVFRSELAYALLERKEREALKDGDCHLAAAIRRGLEKIDRDTDKKTKELASMFNIDGPLPLPPLQQIRWRSTYQRLWDIAQQRNTDTEASLGEDVRGSKARICIRVRSAFLSYGGELSQVDTGNNMESVTEAYYRLLWQKACAAEGYGALSISRRLWAIEGATNMELQSLTDRYGEFGTPATQAVWQQPAGGEFGAVAQTVTSPQPLGTGAGLSARQPASIDSLQRIEKILNPAE